MNWKTVLSAIVLAALLLVSELPGSDIPATKPHSADAITDKSVLAGDDAALLPYLDDHVFLVIRTEPGAFDVQACERWCVAAIDSGKLEKNMAGMAKTELKKSFADAQAGWGKWSESHGGKYYFILSYDDSIHAFAVVTLGQNPNLKWLIDLLAGDTLEGVKPHVEKIGDVLVSATDDYWKILKANVLHKPPSGLAEALKAAGPGPLSVALIPSVPARQALEKAMPQLPDSLGGGQITVLSDGIEWAGFGLTTAADPEMHLIVKARDVHSADKLMKLEAISAKWAATQSKNAEFDVNAALNHIVPTQDGSRITLSLGNAKLQELFVMIGVQKLLLNEAEPTTQPANQPAAQKSFEVPDLKMKFAYIPASEFQMGSPADEPGRRDNELQHPVKLTKPFYIQTTEVSQWQYKMIMESRPSYFRGNDLPVENISWDEAVAFCEKLGKREGRKFRLPTEAEWEYAARGGKDGPVSGTGKLEEMAWQANNSGTQPLDSAKLWDTNPNTYFEVLTDNAARTRAVGRGTPNDWGLHDMQGNVGEWVADWYSPNYFADASARVDPQGPRESDRGSRVIRGGAWSSDPRNCRLAYRDWNTPDSRSGSRGFRVVMDVE